MGRKIANCKALKKIENAFASVWYLRPLQVVIGLQWPKQVSKLESLSKDFIRGAQKFEAVALAKHSEEWFRTRSSSILLGESEIQGHRHVMINDFSSSRIAVMKALYPAGHIQPSAFSAVKALAALIPNRR